MLKRLRLQLTFLYILVAIGLVALISFGSYSLVRYYFQRETDLALEYTMAAQFRQYGLTPPTELQRAERSWLGNMAPYSAKTQVATTSPRYAGGEEGDDEGEEGHASTALPAPQEERSEGERESKYDGQLASIFVLPIDASGNVIQNPNQASPPFAQDSQASQAALRNGSDLRTTRLSDGTRLRLLTYRVQSSSGPAVLQAGRTLVDQDRVLSQFWIGLVIFGSISSALLGLLSWWLSGRSLRATQRAWEQQQAFVSNASHELRTPLTLIKASAEVSLRGQAQGEQRQLLQDILDETDYMSRLVDDLLLLSRLDTRRIQLQREPVSLPELIEETVRQAEKLAAGKGIRFGIGRTGGVILGDPTRLRQVLLILIDNAIRFTPQGGLIRLETVSRRKTYQIVVQDNGQGIAPEHLPHLFERFYQANPTGEGLARNNGLGLSIAKKVIEIQGGEISIESQLGVGTRVLVELPAA